MRNVDLNLLVAKAEGYDCALLNKGKTVGINRNNVVDYFDPADNWGWGGPIVEREEINLETHANVEEWDKWTAYSRIHGLSKTGPTPLVAAMRLFVAIKQENQA